MKKIDLGFTIDGEKLAEKIRDSHYMQNEGYSVHYDREITAKDAAKEDRTMKKLPPDQIVGFGICLVQDDRGDYVHFRMKVGQVSWFNCLAFVADTKKLSVDLAELIDEIDKSNVP